MAELTVYCLSMLPYDESSKSNHFKKWPVTSVIEWAQCFTHYIAVLSKAKPERTSDLLGYQHLILEAHLEYAGDEYDRRFRQIAATYPDTPWPLPTPLLFTVLNLQLRCYECSLQWVHWVHSILSYNLCVHGGVEKGQTMLQCHC